jgi:hypothetical protein
MPHDRLRWRQQGVNKCTQPRGIRQHRLNRQPPSLRCEPNVGHPSFSAPPWVCWVTVLIRPDCAATSAACCCCAWAVATAFIGGGGGGGACAAHLRLTQQQQQAEHDLLISN